MTPRPHRVARLHNNRASKQARQHRRRTVITFLAAPLVFLTLVAATIATGA